MTSLVDQRPDDAERIVSESSTCLKKPEIKRISLQQIYQYHEKHSDFFGIRLFVKRNNRDPFTTQYRYSLQKWYWEKNDINLKHHIRNEFKELNHPETTVWLNEMNLYKEAQKDMKEFMALEVWTRPKFDSNAFNASLEAYLLKLKNFKDRYQPLASSSQVDLAIVTTRMLAKVYNHVGEKIQRQNPPGLDPEIANDFKRAMKNLSSQFVVGSNQYDKNLEKALREKEALAWGSRSIASVEEVENPVFSFFTGLTMDKSKE
jgi:hypothetical protein